MKSAVIFLYLLVVFFCTSSQAVVKEQQSLFNQTEAIEALQALISSSGILNPKNSGDSFELNKGVGLVTLPVYIDNKGLVARSGEEYNLKTHVIILISPKEGVIWTHQSHFDCELYIKDGNKEGKNIFRAVVPHILPFFLPESLNERCNCEVLRLLQEIALALEGTVDLGFELPSGVYADTGRQPVPFPYDSKTFYFLDEEKIPALRPLKALEEEMVSYLADCIKANPEWKKKAAQGVLVISLGSSTGRDADYFIETMSHLTDSAVHYLGVDNEENAIAHATKWHDENSNNKKYIRFYTRDACEAAGFIRIQAAQYRGFLTLVVALRFLCAGNTIGTYGALRVMQQVALSGVADLMVMAAQTKGLVPNDSFKMAGWQLKQNKAYNYHFSEEEKTEINNYPSEQPTYYIEIADDFIEQLSKSPFEVLLLVPAGVTEQADYVMERSLARRTGENLKTLDLSRSSHPDKLFLKLQEEHSGRLEFATTVDLSWSALPVNWSGFFGELQKHSVTNIIFSGNEPWYQAVAQWIRANRRFSIYLRHDHASPAEVNALPPFLAREFKKIDLKRHYNREQDNIPVAPASGQPLPVDLMDFLTKHKLREVTTPGDGLCLYHAAAINTVYTGPELQMMILDYVIHNIGQLIQEGMPPEVLEGIITDIQQGHWANQAHIVIAARVLGRPILLIYLHKGKLKFALHMPDGKEAAFNQDTFDFQNAQVVIHIGNHFFAAEPNPLADITDHLQLLPEISTTLHSGWFVPPDP